MVDGTKFHVVGADVRPQTELVRDYLAKVIKWVYGVRENYRDQMTGKNCSCGHRTA